MIIKCNKQVLQVVKTVGNSASNITSTFDYENDLSGRLSINKITRKAMYSIPKSGMRWKFIYKHTKPIRMQCQHAFHTLKHINGFELQKSQPFQNTPS